MLAGSCVRDAAGQACEQSCITQGCTLAAVAAWDLPAFDQHSLPASAGDCRAVLVRGGQALQLTSDHKATRPDEVVGLSGLLLSSE